MNTWVLYRMLELNMIKIINYDLLLTFQIMLKKLIYKLLAGLLENVG